MKLAIDGMHCQGCVQRVRQAITKVEGAQIQQIEVGSAVVAIDPAREAMVLEAVRKAGYEPHKSE
jgi:copper chaperone